MQRRSHWLVLGALATVVVACSSPMGNNVPTDVVSTQDIVTPSDTPVADVQSPVDRPTGQDGGSMDASKGDASTADASGDGATDDVTKGDAARGDVDPVDVPPGTGVCAPSAVIDLNAMGTTSGATTRITRNNNGADAMSPLTTSCTGSTGHEVVFRYTPRTAARLRVSTDNAGTDMNFDTVVFARSACAGALGDGGVTELGCNDDNGTAPRGRASTFTTTAPVAMGTPIYLVVAGYTPTTGAPYTEQGTFELSVTEITVAPIGGACDPAGVASVCAGGARCAANAASGDAAVTGTCIADGAAGGNCRATTSDAGAGACDTGLTCTGGRCLRAIPLGGACDPTSTTSACASGGRCGPGDGGTVCLDAAAPYDPCAAAAVIDLNAMGATSGATTRITRNNNGVGTMSPLATTCTTSTGHEVVFRYTPRMASRLRVSTDNAGTDMNFDTVVFARSACAGALGDGGVTELGCSDDNGTAPRGRASAFTTAAVSAGVPIYVVVAGYTPAAGAFTEQGTFELSVVELTVSPVGGACDPAGVTSSCAAGSRCVEGAATGDAGATGTCVADGARNGNCRAAADGGAASVCDAGLVCAGGLCFPSIAAGGACGVLVVGACVTGTSCGGPSGAQRCIADGALGGACRAGDAGAGCDTGLTCDTGACIRSVATGGACDPYDPAVVCAMGTSCAPATSGSTCQSDGTAGGARCRAAAPLCDTGLTCDGMVRPVCRGAGTLGGACNVRLNSVACPAGSACLATSATAATCAMGRAETEPNNTPAAPQAAVTSSTVFSGSLGGGDAGADPADCYAVTVPASGTVIAETSAPGHPGCDANDTVATLYNAAGAQVATNDDGDRHGLCSLLVAPSLPAGTYALCVRPYVTGGAIASYLVSISVYGP